MPAISPIVTPGRAVPVSFGSPEEEEEDPAIPGEGQERFGLVAEGFKPANCEHIIPDHENKGYLTRSARCLAV